MDFVGSVRVAEDRIRWKDIGGVQTTSQGFGID